MRLLVQIVGLILLGSCPTAALAQAAPAEDREPSQPTAASPALTPHSAAGHAGRDKPAGLPSATTVGGSLALVLGIFFVVVWVFRRASPQGSAALPPEAFEILGRAALANRQQAQLLRCGNKLLLVSVGATGTETLTEITDPAEVDRLTDICRQGRSSGAAAAFRHSRRREEEQDG
jgi:flagellar protein FliO/FliZ